jgi:hypothetical protein
MKHAIAAALGPGVKASPLGKAYPDVDWPIAANASEAER